MNEHRFRWPTQDQLSRHPRLRNRWQRARRKSMNVLRVVAGLACAGMFAGLIIARVATPLVQ